MNFSFNMNGFIVKTKPKSKCGGSSIPTTPTLGRQSQWDKSSRTAWTPHNNKTLSEGKKKNT
jgi:hypothetical protein